MILRSLITPRTLRSTALGLALPFLGVSAVLAEQQEGRIDRYECGDNCYLIITTTDGDELSGLCAAEACQAWNEVAEMPQSFIGRRIRALVEMGQQTDNEGNVMGEFPAFTEIEFLKG